LSDPLSARVRLLETRRRWRSAANLAGGDAHEPVRTPNLATKDPSRVMSAYWIFLANPMPA